MGGLSATHLLILIVILVVLFAPKRIGQAGQSMGEAIRGFKKGMKGDEIDVTEQSRQNLNASQPSDFTSQQQRAKDKTRQDS